MLSRLGIRRFLADRTLSMGASGRHPRRALFGSVLALTLASPLVWTAPASAATTPIEGNPVCIDSWAGYWYLGGFDRPAYGITSTWEDEGSGGSITFTATVPRESLNYASFTIAFYQDNACEGENEILDEDPTDADSTAPKGFKMCLAATDGALSESYMEFARYYDANGDPDEQVEGQAPSFGSEYDLGSVSGRDWPPARIDFGAFLLNDEFDEFTFQVSFGPGPDCELRTGPDEKPSLGLDLDIDRETFLNRASAGALPDTL